MSNDTWETPHEVYAALNDEFNFAFDVCAETETAKCKDFWTIEDDSLSRDWQTALSDSTPNQWLWCNPPYSNISPWVEKAIEAQLNGVGTAMLVMCDPSVKWFARALEYCSEVRFITRGRLAFLRNGSPGIGNNKGSVVFIFNPHSISAAHTSYITREELIFKGQTALEAIA